jgi:Barstar (barnase inhibitor)
MRVIELDATNWRSFQDFNDALKVALGSIKGHGNSANAWIDSMIYGGLNAIEVPYVIRITGTANCDKALKDEIIRLSEMIRDARAWKLKHYGKDVDISLRIEDGSKNSN